MPSARAGPFPGHRPNQPQAKYVLCETTQRLSDRDRIHELEYYIVHDRQEIVISDRMVHLWADRHGASVDRLARALALMQTNRASGRAPQLHRQRFHERKRQSVVML